MFSLPRGDIISSEKENNQGDIIMRTFIDSVDSLPLLVKVILAIPALDIIWGIYRIVCALDEKDVVALIAAVVLMFIPFTWILDIICIIAKGNVWRYGHVL